VDLTPNHFQHFSQHFLYKEAHYTDIYVDFNCLLSTVYYLVTNASFAGLTALAVCLQWKRNCTDSCKSAALLKLLRVDDLSVGNASKESATAQ